MMSLFSSFDLYVFYKQIASLMLLVLALNSYNFLYGAMKNMVHYVFSYLQSFFNSIKDTSPKMVYSTIISIFITLFVMNFMSVNSFNFPFTSQVSIVLSVSLTFWFSFILISIKNSTKSFLSHMVPMGTPMMLVWFLFLIEMVSNFIRFITLTVRLTANILSGHLLMILLSSLALKSVTVSTLFMALNLVEFMVSLIQSYIFCTMLTLYFSEVE